MNKILNKLETYKSVTIYIFAFLILIPILNFIHYINGPVNRGHQWYTAEWLINYNYGFVRRGMFGSFFIDLPFLPIEILYTMTFFIDVILIIYFYTIIKLFLAKKQNTLSYLLLLSPGFLLFALTNLEYAFRKEIIGLATFSCFVYSYNSKFKKVFLYTSVFLNVVGIFSAEYNIYFLFPLLYYIFLYDRKNLNYYSALYVSPLFIYFSLYFKTITNTKNLSELICIDLKSFNYYGDFCDGAIKWLGYDFFETINTTLSFYQSSPDYILYLFYGALVLSPIFFTKIFQDNFILSIFFLLSFIPLFIISLDWGRHIYIIVSIFTILHFDNKDKFFTKLKKRTKFIYFVIFLYITLPAFDPKFSEMLSPKMFVDKFLILLNPNNIVEFIYSSSNILNEMLRAIYYYFI